LPRVTSIFTRSAISPGLWLRQQRSRYAIRAGRNLPDKEFRYLRMVIVTTAVYWGLNSQLRTQSDLTGHLNLPAPGRRQTIYLNFTSSHGPVILINSRFPLFSASTPRSTSKEHHVAWSLYIRKYGGYLPYSLTTVISIALVFSN